MSSTTDDRHASLEPLVARLERLAAWPEAGAGAGLVTALATDLVSAAAATSASDWDEAGGAIAQASALRRRCLDLGCANADAYVAARAALAAAGERAEGEPTGDAELGELLMRAADTPLAIAEVGADAAALAALTAERVAPDSRANAAGAALLAAAAARVAAHLVEINLSMSPDDARIGRARELVAQAGDAAERALAVSD
jgi:formiminotetrahydrofolate cyclodeaminase